MTSETRPPLESMQSFLHALSMSGHVIGPNNATRAKELLGELAEIQHRLATWDTMLVALNCIALAAGNLPDERLVTKTGPNDAANRGFMLVAARRLAREALAAAENRP